MTQQFVRCPGCGRWTDSGFRDNLCATCAKPSSPHSPTGTVADLVREWRDNPCLACAAELERRLAQQSTVPVEAVWAVVDEMRSQTEQREYQGHDIWVWRVQGWVKRLTALLPGERSDGSDG